MAALADLDPVVLVSLAGLLAGAVLGMAARFARYCMMGAVEDAVLGQDLSRIRMVALSAAIAMAASWGLVAGGLLDPSLTRFARPGWSPGAAVLGGLIFGYGMALVGTCGFGALARAGGGDLRSLLIAGVIGVSAYAAQSGPLAPLRLLLQPEAGQEGHVESLAEAAGALTGLPALTPALIAAAALAAFALWPGGMRAGKGQILWPLAVGLAIAGAWAATAAAERVGFGETVVENLSFTAAPGEALVYLMTETGLSAPGFSVASVLGVILGAGVAAGLMGEWRWEACDDARELRRQTIGAAMMGFGGVLALGCTVGQGLSAMSMLAPSAPIVVISILVGARLGLLVLVEGIAPGR